MQLVLVGDEQESMVRKYVDDGRMFAAFCEEEPVAVILVVPIGCGEWEIKNVAVDERFRRRGLGLRMVSMAESVCGAGQRIFVGTGEAPRTLRFYARCGYTFSHRLKDFFVMNYDHPVVDDGVLLRDMVYFVKHT